MFRLSASNIAPLTLLSVLGVLLAACEPAPEAIIASMSVSDLEASLSSGASGERAVQIRLRLAQIYGKHGRETQKARGARFAMDLTSKGNMDAAEILCMPAYLEAKPAEAEKACALAADAKRAYAIAAMCTLYFEAGQTGLALSVCEDGANQRLSSTYLATGLLYAGKIDDPERSGEIAAKWLVRAALDGPWRDRDVAIETLQTLDAAPQFHKQPELQAQRAGNEQPAVAITEAQPVRPARFTDRGQCYLKYAITPTGLIWDTTIQCSHPQLIDPVMEAAHQWRFTPRTISGKAVYSYNQSTTMTFSAR